jgi:hypothetical protein
METSQGNSLKNVNKATFLSNNLKCHVFHFLFSSTKLENRRIEEVLHREEGWHQWEGGGVGEKG